MSDMTKGSNLDTRNVETLADAQQATNSMKPEHIKNESITNRTTTASESTSSTAAKEEVISKITPMMVEERARTIREVKEEGKETHQHLSSSISAMTINLENRRSLSCISISCFQ